MTYFYDLLKGSHKYLRIFIICLFCVCINHLVSGQITINPLGATCQGTTLQQLLDNSGNFTVRSEGENWIGLAAVLSKTALTDVQKADIQEILRIDDVNVRKDKLKAYDGGQPYQYLLKEIYPNLRRTDYKIEYTVPAFTVEKGKELLKSKPSMLSLNEMYMIAGEYEKGSPEFNEVFETALKIYPNDAVANVNAAAVALERKETGRAASYLKSKNQAAKAYYNNIGVCYMLEGNFDEAEKLFSLAVESGSKEAVKNKAELAKVRESEEKYSIEMEEYRERMRRYEEYRKNFEEYSKSKMR